MGKHKNILFFVIDYLLNKNKNLTSAWIASYKVLSPLRTKSI